MTDFTLGAKGNGSPFKADIAKIVGTRMLIQANSGGGKSFAIRRILEQTYGQVQHIIIDPEGEFSTLRERFDKYLLIGHDGDLFVPVHRANFYARKLLDVRASVIVDISEFELDDRLAFVDKFLTGLIHAPFRGKQRSVLVVLDEAHIFCPEVGASSSSRAVVDLVTRGRKRGIGSILATQRISKFNKNAAAELQNIMIGLTNLDIDMKRAGDVLGLTTKEDRAELRRLKPGEFFCFGPAFEGGVHRVKVGSVETTHPEAGTAMMLPSLEPTDEIKKVLESFAEADHDAERDAADFEDAQKVIGAQKREINWLKRSGGGVNEKEVERQVNAVRREAARAEKAASAIQDQELARVRREAEAAIKAERAPAEQTRKKLAGLHQRIQSAALEMGTALGEETQAQIKGAAPEPQPRPPVAWPKARPATPRPLPDANGEVHLKTGAKRMLGVLVSRHPARWTRAQLAALVGMKQSGGTYGSYLSALRTAGYLAEDGKHIGASDIALDVLDVIPAAPESHAEMMAMWSGKLKTGCSRMLGVIVDIKAGISRLDLADAVGMVPTGGTYGSYLSNLRTNGLIEERGGLIYPADILWPEGVGNE